MKGPDFLLRSEQTWPKRPVDMGMIPDNDPEVELEEQVHAITLDEPVKTMVRMFAR